MKTLGLIFIVLVLFIGNIFVANRIDQKQKTADELQSREAKRSIILPGKFENLSDTLTVTFRDYTKIRLIAEYDLNTFAFRNSKDKYLGQDQFIWLMKKNIADEMYSNAFKLEVLKTAYSEKRKETILQFFFDTTNDVLDNSNNEYPGAIKTLKITVISNFI